MALADGRGRRDADHDVGELPPGRLPHPQPAQLDARAERGDRRAGGLLGVGGSAVHQHVDVPAHQPCRRDQHEHGDEERGERVAVRMTCPHDEQPDEDRDRPGQVAREVERVRGQRGAPGAPATSAATSRSRLASTTITTAIVANTYQEVCTFEGREPKRRSRARDADQDARRREERRLGERREVLRLPVAVLVRDVGGPHRDAEGEEREQRRDEIRPGVNGLRHEPEALRRRGRPSA